jgi:type IV pilus assembly protein PilE
MKNIQKAFTLVELMVTVAIIGILAGIAYPSYLDSVVKSRRTDAKAGLVKFAAMMVRQQTEAGTYVGYSTPSASDYYTFSASNVTKTTFTLSAAPKSVQTSDACGTLTHSDIQGHASGASHCW